MKLVEAALEAAGFKKAKVKDHKIVREGFLCHKDGEAVTVSDRYPKGATAQKGILERYLSALSGLGGTDRQVCMPGTCCIMPSHVHVYFD